MDFIIVSGIIAFMESFGKEEKSYKKFKEAMLKPVALGEQKDAPEEQDPLFEGLPPQEKLNYFSLDASMLSKTAIEISVLIDMAKEKNIDITNEMQTIGEKFYDFFALGGGERSFSEMSEVTQKLFWQLRKKVANDEATFTEVLERTKQREESLLQERDSYLAGD